MNSAAKPHLLLTGPPGCGKTTIIARVVKEIHAPISGFFTSEIREQEKRVGFFVKTTDGEEGILAHVDFKSPYRIGRYGIDVAGFEKLVLPRLMGEAPALYVIDEIGKMECLSRDFCTAVRKILAQDVPLLGTIAMKGGGFIAEVRMRGDLTCWEVTPANRHSLPAEILKKLWPIIEKQ